MMSSRMGRNFSGAGPLTNILDVVRYRLTVYSFSCL